MYSPSLGTSTVLIAGLGIISQIQIYGWLGLLQDAIPQSLTSSSCDTTCSATTIQNQVIRSVTPQIEIDKPLDQHYKVNEKDQSLDIEGLDFTIPPWEVENALKDLQEQQQKQKNSKSKDSEVNPDPQNSKGGEKLDGATSSSLSHSKSSTSYYLPWIHSTPITTTNTSNPSSDSNFNSWYLFSVLKNDQIGKGKAEREQKSYDLARLTTQIVRLYVILSMGFCVTGIVGVWKSNPLLSRLFVIHSFLDLFLCAASIISLAILCSYPSVKTYICEGLSSGEFNSIFSKVNIEGQDSTVLKTGTHNDRDPSTGELNRWTAMFDGAFGPEYCEESFGALLVPILLLIALAYTSIRLKMFFTTHSFYNSLIQSRRSSHSHSHSHSHHHHPKHQRHRSSTSPTSPRLKNSLMSIEKQA